jgi:hypothetical protein
MLIAVADGGFGQASPDAGPFRGRSYTWVHCDREGGRVTVWASLSAG